MTLRKKEIGNQQIDQNNKGINRNVIESNNMSIYPKHWYTFRHLYIYIHLDSHYPILRLFRLLLPYIWTFVPFGPLEICFVNRFCLTHCNLQIYLGRNVVSVRHATYCYVQGHTIGFYDRIFTGNHNGYGMFRRSDTYFL